MISILHGDNTHDSRSALNRSLDNLTEANILRLDAKNADIAKVTNFLAGTSLLGDKKVLVITNFFSLHKSTQDKLAKIINSSSEGDIFLWQEKKLTPGQLKVFPNSKVSHYPLNQNIFDCLNAVQPGNLIRFNRLYRSLGLDDSFDLFLYFLKNQLRRQLTGYSRFDSAKLKAAYLKLIELDYLNKTGQLPLPKDIALHRILNILLN